MVINGRRFKAQMICCAEAKEVYLKYKRGF
jgi:hypothetical protein